MYLSSRVLQFYNEVYIIPELILYNLTELQGKLIYFNEGIRFDSLEKFHACWVEIYLNMCKTSFL